MTYAEILDAYKTGKLSTTAVQEQLCALKEKISIRNQLSEGQKGLWALQKSSPSMSAYNVPICFRIRQKLSIENFIKAFHCVLEQHPILNSVIRVCDGVPCQIFQPSPYLDFQQKDISTFKSQEILPYLRKKTKEPFVLERGPLMRVHFLSRSEIENIVLIVIHHIVFDGSSVEPFLSTLINSYLNLVQKKKPNPTSFSASYNDFVTWEQDMLASGEGEEHRSYWRQQLAGTLPVLELPADYPRIFEQSIDGQVLISFLGSKLSKQIRSLAQSWNINVSVMFLGLFKALLYRYTGQEDIIVGMPTLGRPQEKFYSQIGYFVNMIAIRSQISGMQSFVKYLQDLQLIVVDGLDHAAYPFPILVKELNVPRMPAYSPVFQANFVYQNFVSGAGLKKLLDHYQNLFSIEFVEGIHQEGEYEFELEVFEQEDGFVLNFKYDLNLFSQPTIERMIGHYKNLIKEVISKPDLMLSEYTLLSAEEQRTILIDWNATQADYPKDKCMHELFEQQTQETPEAIAVVYEGNSLTYQKLDEKSTQLAIYLQTKGVGPDCLVGICIERSLDMIVGLLGILKAGGAYVPLDPGYPPTRLEYMVEDSRAALILTQAGLLSKMSQLLKNNNRQAIAIDNDWKVIKRSTAGKKGLEREVRPNHLAYVIYTSGSTGKPKGVMVSHQGLTNFLATMGNTPGLTSKDMMLAITTYCFDIAGLELYLPLTKGAKCNICSSAKIKDAAKLKQEIQRLKPTIMQATPATWTMLFHCGWKNEEKIKILCGGEAMSETLKQKFMDYDCNVYNLFGPTETTIWSTVQKITADAPITIGKPIANTQIYILDENLKPIPIGIPGELYIAGDGLARGYLNKPELTAEKFIDNPFNPGEKFYVTGDLARWMPSGNIEFMGRSDFQVKIRGYRIELGEIETQLRNHPQIQECVVIVKEYEHNKQLIAYYVAQNQVENSPNLQQLRDYLRSSLPEYMLPALYIQLDNIPLTPNGKTDRKELMNRPVGSSSTKKTSVRPSYIAEKVREIWETILNINILSTEDGFFDIGGDSVSAVLAVEKINEELACDITVTALFKYANINELSTHIAKEKWIDVNGQGGATDKRKIAGINTEKPDNKKSCGKKAHPDHFHDSLAIIGISCQFPEAKNHVEFWHNLREGKESIRFLAKEELNEFDLPQAIVQNPNYVPLQSTIEGKDLFDPGFYDISPRDAEFMDPQLRLLLNHSWKAVEDAGYISEQIPETSVFMSASNTLYQALLPRLSSKVISNSDEYVSWILAQGGTIANMISHKLGLKGPSFFVHSNCSSSLIGLYSAYQSLRACEAKYALVGGATIFPFASLGYVYQPGLNFSGDGHVKTFDASADGMIGSEGVAVIVLKKAEAAIEDGDHIYALVRGIAVNNDGADKVGFYAPGVKGQADVIQKVLNSTNIHPESISYIEAHGTGTKLGDPIEFAALNDVYRQYTSKKQFCGIGSVKTNIGHTDTVAGLAGCIKVALSLFHNEIPPSINYKEPNPNIDLDNSPFYVIDKLKNIEPSSTPHRAAVSSFGIGGTNTHAILEQFIVEKDQQHHDVESNANSFSCILPLSAKNNDRLTVYTKELLKFLHNSGGEKVNLADLVYTFQVGREAMDSRVIFIIDNFNELKQKLKLFVDGKENIQGCYRGKAKQSEDYTHWLEDEDAKGLINKWIINGDIRKLAEMWINGFRVDWELLYSDAKPHRISLPTYPFAEERYWAAKDNNKYLGNVEKDAAMGNLINPLLHYNTSNMFEQRFSSKFMGREFFLSDHLVRGKPVLPGVAYIEMAREAVCQSTAVLKDSSAGIRLKNIVWSKPIVLENDSIQIHIRLFPEENETIAYEIYSESEIDSDPIVYSQGGAELYSNTELPVLKITDIQARCNQSVISPLQFYKEARKEGIFHGPGFRGIEKIYTGNGQVLTKLSLPDSVAFTKDSYMLHPSMMDSAVQTAMICLQMNLGHSKLPLPFALDELEVVGKCTTAMWAFARPSETKTGKKSQKIDVELCDETGTVCVRMKGFSARILEGELGSSEASLNTESLILAPSWKQRTVSADAKAPEYIKHIVILCEPEQVVAKNLETQMKGVHCITLEANQGRIQERFQYYAIKAFKEVQNILIDKLEGNVLIQIVVPAHGEQQIFSGLLGLLKTARLENSKLVGQLIETAINEDSKIQEKLQENILTPNDKYIRYQDHKRYVADWSEVEVLPGKVSIPWKNNGKYLITGGAGELGFIFAREIANKTRNVTLILTGRSALKGDKITRLDKLRNKGARIEYLQSDVTDKDAVDSLFSKIVGKYDNLDCIIHCAGIIRDNFIVNKTQEEIEQVLAPKVAGLVNLDEASKELELQCFIIFSSISGSLGALGQADYSMANAFSDAFAGYRNDLANQKQRHGKTISFNWSLWKEGGMRVDEESKEIMRHNTGIVAMETEKGIQAFYKGMAAGKHQIMVVEGVLPKIKSKLFGVSYPDRPQSKKNTSESYPITRIDTESLLGKVLEAIKQEVSILLKVVENIDPNTELTKYGFDSISMTEFANRLNRKYKLELTPTIFFENPTLYSFAKYITEEYQTAFASKFEMQDKDMAYLKSVEQDQKRNKEEKKLYTQRRRPRFARRQMEIPALEHGSIVSEPIAIIGISGIFPMARDIDEFWKNLEEGKDCVTEIPEDRWDWREYYGDADKEVNKTSVKWGGFIDGIGDFDPLFFGVSPKEAELMDPQQRLLLTYAWKVIEDAGYSARSLSGTNTGIFVGTGSTGYSSLLDKANIEIEGSAAANMNLSVGPNRVSYFLNIHGPSEPIETACSSSLVAIHHAVSAIKEGTCEMAIAGGVNTIIAPEVYISFDKAGALSKEGRCKTFSDKADGFVHGEGAGMLFLKKMKDAEQAGDHIYGVIKSTAVNHGGRANSFTTPNPRAQAKLLKEAYTQAGVDPRTVTYIETHGTGTKLGDPIEINGLKSVFKDLYQATGDSLVVNSHCGLGSVKTNIGHLSLAAGVAGVIKILLQFKHKKIAKSLHCDSINPYIQLKDSPFYIVQETMEWKVLKNSQGKELPRRAGVSSFGIGGVNAHVVIEEYVPNEVLRLNDTASLRITPQTPAIILLSAKNKERLKEQAKQFLAVISNQQYSDSNLSAMAYTLQVGREAMEERLAIIVTSIKELKEKMAVFIKGQENNEAIYHGQVRRNKEALSIFTEDEQLQEAIDKWIQLGKYHKLSELWVKGLNIDWCKLYGDDKPRRISLPTYPFALERYWVPKRKMKFDDSNAAAIFAPAAIHPLLHQNTSDLSAQRFSTIFSGQEFFLADHVVKEQRILPGVAYLEMARAAVELATEGLEAGEAGIRLKNVVWVKPIAVEDQPVQVHISLFPKDKEHIAYEIHGESKVADIESVVYNQGSAVLYTVAEFQRLDLEELQSKCNHGSISGSQCYEIFKAEGIEFGPGHQGIETVYGGAGQVLAKISLPSCVSNTQDQFFLHPSLMDSALQASMGLVLLAEGISNQTSFKPALPFGLAELEIYGRCTAVMWALIRYADDSIPGDKVQKLDIDLCDDQGNVCVRMKGLSLRVLESKFGSAEPIEALETLMLEPYWQEQAVVDPHAPDAVYDRHLVMLCDSNEVLQKRIETHMSGARCLVLQSGKGGIEERFQRCAVRAFEEIQSILINKPYGGVLIQVVVPNQGEQRLFSGLAGLLKTARLENSKITGQLIEVEMDEEPGGIINKLQESGRNSLHNHIRYQDGKRYAIGWREFEAPQNPTNLPWKYGGVYLITGGAGGLGIIFSREIAHQIKNVTLILNGRSPLNDKKLAQIQELEVLGARIVYKQIDVTREKAVAGLFQNIREDFGGLNGIIHSAGVISDNLIIDKTKEKLQEVLASKVTGLVNIDNASKELPLDFFILFSSVASVFGNIGQADYSTANAFMDAYANYRNALVDLKQRQGQTLAVNWPLWREGGMAVDAATEKMMLQTMDMAAMRTSTGIRALYQSLGSGQAQMVVMEGKVAYIKQKLFSTAAPAARQFRESPAATGAAAGMNNSNLKEKVQAALIMAVSKSLKVDSEHIDVDTELNEYGFDSITLTEFAYKLNEQYSLKIIPTIFFEHPTLHKFAKYLVDEYPAIFAAKFGVQAEYDFPVTGIKEKAAASSSGKNQRTRFSEHVFNLAETEAIAIVGMSGRFPMAGDVDEFWQNIVEGKDCITEVPRDRWDWRKYYGDPGKEDNKTKIKWGGFIDGVDEFDPLFFGISPREAELMDPQQRLLMTSVWQTVEDAGITPEALSQSPTGVFITGGFNEYMNLVPLSQNASLTITGAVPSIIPNRISYTLNLHGPSEYCEAACASVFVALHRAVQSIYRNECEQAIVGAVNLLLSPLGFIGFEAMGYLSIEGKTKPFQAEAGGYVRSEGVGAIIIKPLHKAIENLDHIYAVIKGTGVTHGGKGMSLTAPHALGMKTAMVQAYQTAGIDPRTVPYIEAHGIASPVGDGIEINALKAAYRELTAEQPQNYPACFIGSLKPCIGHGEIVSGMAALFKVSMAIRNKIIPGIPGYETPHENISLTESPFQITAENKHWQASTDTNGKSLPRRASINSYGFGGVNAHVVLEEYIPSQEERMPTASTSRPQIVVFSAKNTDRLKAVIEQMLEFIEFYREFSLADFAYTLQVGREAMKFRLAMVVNNQAELILGLKAYLRSIKDDKEIEASIPIFRGNTADHTGLKSLISGKIEDTMVKTFLAEKNLEKIALFWTQDGKIPWEFLHEGQGVRRISLPAYPFEKRRCWIQPQVEPGLAVEWHRPSDGIANKAGTAFTSLDADVINIMSRLLGILPAEINLNKPMNEYGFDSIILMQLLKQLQTEVDPTIELVTLQESRTIRDIINVIRSQNEEKPALPGQQLQITIPAARPQFPELIRLNQDTEGRPVFWFHPIQGGVEAYQTLAQKIQRPFYGIQARGWMNDHSPLHGIQRMASYYTHIVQSVQPEGPYDLGGYSLGGVLAYEAARQLQELEEMVHTVVMVDSPDSTGLKQVNLPRKSVALQAINIVLAAATMQEPGKLASILIHRDEVNTDMEEEEFIQQIVALAQTRGVVKTDTQLNTFVQQIAKVQQAYEMDNFAVLPLPDPQSVTCYYFRNKNGVFLGELEPYHSITTDEISLDYTNYWNEWEQQFINFYMTDLDSSNHMVLLSEPKAYETIFAFCKELYSGKEDP